MKRIRDNFVSSLDHQGLQIQADIRHLEQLLKSQLDSNQVKRIAESFFNRELDYIKREICYIKQAIDTNQEEIERVDVQVHKKLGNLVHILQIKLIFRYRENVLKGIVSRTGECFPWNPLEGRGLRHLYVFIMYRMAQILPLYENLGKARVLPDHPDTCHKVGVGSKNYVLGGLLGPQNKPLLLERRNEVGSTSLKVPLTTFQTRSLESNGEKKITAQEIKY